MWSLDALLLLTLFVMSGNGNNISVPLLDNVEAPLKAVIDMSRFNQRLNVRVKQEIEESLQGAVQKVLNDVDVKLLEFRRNLTFELENIVSAWKHRTAGPTFSAVFKPSSTFKLLGDEEVLKFDEVYLNRGGGYDPSTGYFTAPMSGIYQVTSTVRPYGTNLHCYLWHNTKRVGLIFGGGWNTGSLQISLNVVKGDKLSVKHASGRSGEKIQLGDTSMFSVVYLSE